MAANRADTITVRNAITVYFEIAFNAMMSQLPHSGALYRKQAAASTGITFIAFIFRLGPRAVVGF